MGGAETRSLRRRRRELLIEVGRVRSAVDPHHGPAAEPAQRFVVSLRARRRSGRGRLGQPPGLRVDSGIGRRRTGRGRDRRRPAADAARADRAAVRAIASEFWESRSRPPKCARILTALGNREAAGRRRERVEVVPPSWRRDLTREIDLVEEVARIHGYDEIPEDVSVPMAPSHRGPIGSRAGPGAQALLAAGLDEAMTLSVVERRSPRRSAPGPMPRRCGFRCRSCAGPIACGGA